MIKTYVILQNVIRHNIIHLHNPKIANSPFVVFCHNLVLQYPGCYLQGSNGPSKPRQEVTQKSPCHG